MTDSTPPKPDSSAEPTQSVTNVSSGVNLDAQHDVNIGGDVVGRDKTTTNIDTQGGTHVAGDVNATEFVGRDKIINVASGATLIIGERPAPKEELSPSLVKRRSYEPEMLLVPAGPFLMGRQPGPGIESSETPLLEVTLPAYYISKYPVTNRGYAEFIQREVKHDEPKDVGWWLRKPPEEKLDHPVVGVSWHDAVAYCRWLGQQTDRTYRLPTEAEWEKAARYTDGRTYPWGNDWRDNLCNVGGSDTTPVTAHPDGASPFGCEDMLGNAEEWTSTLWSTDDPKVYAYPYQINDGREDMDNDRHLFRPQRVRRGGSYRDKRGNLRCSARARSQPSSAVSWRGFRVVLEL